MIRNINEMFRKNPDPEGDITPDSFHKIIRVSLDSIESGGDVEYN